jgi:hypothetical protein
MAIQTRMAKDQELTGIFAIMNGCSTVVVTTVMPLRMLRYSRSVVVSRHIHRGDEAVTAPGDVDDESMPVLAITQRTTQRGHVNGEVCGLNENIGPNASHQVLLTDQLSVVFKQSDQELQSPAPERYGLVALEKKELRRKQAKRSE